MSTLGWLVCGINVLVSVINFGHTILLVRWSKRLADRDLNQRPLFARELSR